MKFLFMIFSLLLFLSVSGAPAGTENAPVPALPAAVSAPAHAAAKAASPAPADPNLMMASGDRVQYAAPAASPAPGSSPDLLDSIQSFQPKNRDLYVHQVKEGFLAVLRWDGFEGWRLLCLLIGSLISVGIALCLYAILSGSLISKLFRNPPDWLLIVTESVAWPLSVLVLVTGTFLGGYPVLDRLTPALFTGVERIVAAVDALAVALIVYNLVKLVERYLGRILPRNDDATNALVVGVIGKLIKTILMVIALLFIADNILRLNITALLAGAGVIGLAVAFAAQDTIANFFGSIIILFERPFKVGDFIQLDSFQGTVQRLGLRSTILKTLEGHIITVPNKITANTSLVNVTVRPYIKKVTGIGLVYDTTPEQMKQAKRILEDILRNHEGMNPALPPRVRFTSFDDYAMTLELVVWYHPGDVARCADWWERVNFEILKRFSEAGLEMAFPTNTTYLAYDPKRAFPAVPAQKKD